VCYPGWWTEPGTDVVTGRGGDRHRRPGPSPGLGAVWTSCRRRSRPGCRGPVIERGGSSADGERPAAGVAVWRHGGRPQWSTSVSRRGRHGWRPRSPLVRRLAAAASAASTVAVVALTERPRSGVAGWSLESRWRCRRGDGRPRLCTGPPGPDHVVSTSSGWAGWRTRPRRCVGAVACCSPQTPGSTPRHPGGGGS